MTMDEKYPILYGYTEDNERTELHGINEVAEYICKEGLHSDLKIVTELDQLLVNTMGIYLDKVYDMEYRDELMKVLAPMQQNLGGGCAESDEDRIEREINDYLESEEYEVDLAIEVRWYQEEGMSVPSNDFIESVLVKRRREQLEKEIECEKEGHRWKETNADPENGTSDMECENCGMTDHIQWM